MKYGFGVDVGGTTVKLGLLSEAGELLEKWELPSRTENGGENILPDIARSVQDCMARRGLSRDDCLGLGIGVPGPVDASGMVNRCVNLNWGVFNLHDALGILTGLRVRAGNDANCAALGEFWMGGGSGCRSAIFVTLGTGIGGGLVIDGKVVHGLVHPEMGHMLLAPQEGDSMPDGVCPYHRHCLEGLASGPAIEKRWGLSAKLMTEDHPAWELEATYLAQMCVNMIVTVSPEVIVLGGGVMQQMHLFPQIRERVLKLLGGYVSSPSITPEGIDSYIVPPALGVNSGVIGALLLGAQALEKEGER